MFSPLRYENLDGKRIRLTEDFTFNVSAVERICVPAGFECDGQSYPRLLWMIDTPQGKGARAGVVHDYLYSLNGRPCSNGKCYTRKEADQIYRRALEAAGINAFSRAVRFRALRWFGWAAWRSHAKRIDRTAPELARLEENPS